MVSSNPSTKIDIRRVLLGEKQVECSEHGMYVSSGEMLYLTDTKSKELWTSCPDCEKARKDNERRAEQQRLADAETARWADLLGRTGLPKRLLKKSFENYRCLTPGHEHVRNVARAYAKNFSVHAEQGTGLLFMGTPGTGKGHLAAAILQEIMPKHVGIYVTFLELLRTIRNAWRKDSDLSDAQVINRFVNADLLVIDEQGVQYKPEGSERVTLFDVIDGRYREMKPTVIVTNQTVEELTACVGERIYDRIMETCRPVMFEWDSYRPIAARELANG